MTTLLEKNALASDPDFIARVKMAMVNAAVCLPNETYPSDDHVALAVNILAYPDSYAEGFAMAVATLPYIDIGSADEIIQLGVNSVFDAAAGSYEYVDPGGAVMPYPVAAVRGKNFTNAVAIPWWLSGGVLPANCIAAYQPKGAASLAASYVNLANPGTYDAAPGTAPTLVADGWSFDGSTTYLTTNIVHADLNYSVFFAIDADATNPDKVVYGVYQGATQRNHIGPHSTGGPVFTYSNGPVLSVSTAIDGEHTWGYAGKDTYKDGIDNGNINAGGTAPTLAAFVGCRNTSGTPGNFYLGTLKALAVYNIVLSPTQVLAISTAMAAL